METGDELFERVERYFGAAWTKAMLIVVCLAIVATAATTILNLIVIPLWKLARPALPWPVTGSSVIGIIFLALQIGAGAAMGSMILDAFRRRAIVNELETLLPDAQQTHEDTKADHARSMEILRQANGHLKRAGDTMAAAALVLEALVLASRETRTLSDGQIDEIVALLDRMSTVMPNIEDFENIRT